MGRKKRIVDKKPWKDYRNSIDNSDTTFDEITRRSKKWYKSQNEAIDNDKIDKAKEKWKRNFTNSVVVEGDIQKIEDNSALEDASKRWAENYKKSVTKN